MPDSERSAILLEDDTVVAFGRGVECGIRFGHAPTQDREVPRHCGWIVVANGRVMVQAADRRPADGIDAEVRRPIVVTPDSGHPRTLGDGEIWGPDDEIFTVTVNGAHPWELDIVNFRGPTPSLAAPGDLPTVTQRVDLSDELWEMLRAYAGPVLRGERFPATHEQVASQVNWNRMTVRRRLERIYDEFYLRRIDMPDVADMRIQVVEAALTHGLLTSVAG